MKERYVSASEIGTYVYCAKSWQLSQIGAPSQNIAEQGEGIEYHAAPSEQVAAPTVPPGSQEFSPLLSWSFSLRWRFDSSHRDRATFTPRALRILRLALLQPSKRQPRGLPAGLLVYDDAGRQHLQRPLVSHRLRLAGRPDYLVETDGGLVPVELKSSACPRSGPHAAHVAQLMTYCVLVEDAFARPGPYGVLQYSDARRQIPFSADRKREVLKFADEIRRKRGSKNVHRQHKNIGRCRKCGYRSVCEDALS